MAVHFKYIDPTHGDDTGGDGTPVNPYRTPQRALRDDPDDSVIVQHGLTMIDARITAADALDPSSVYGRNTAEEQTKIDDVKRKAFQKIAELRRKPPAPDCRMRDKPDPTTGTLIADGPWEGDRKVCDPGQDYLLIRNGEVYYLYWFHPCGHFHLDRRMTSREATLFLGQPVE